MKDNPTAMVTVGGHTSTTATNDYNLDLSKRRANMVADYLKNKLQTVGVSPTDTAKRMRIAWYGESDLEVDTFDANLPGTTGTELDDNRRVELSVVTSVAPVVPAEDPPGEDEAEKPDTKTHQDTGGSTDQREEDGALAVAAAFALDLADNETSATISGDVTIVAQGTVVVRSQGNTNSAAFADGGAVTTEGGTTVGAAAAINSAKNDNAATIAAATSRPTASPSRPR